METTMSITKKAACVLTLALGLGVALTNDHWALDRESGVAPAVLNPTAAQAYTPPMQSFWVVLAVASAR
jgi:hypothetical protein